MRETVLVLDFGGQYNQLIARRVRDLLVYAEILPCDAPFERILSYNPIGIIFTGGPASVTDDDAPCCDERIFSAGIPILGICYGAQLMGAVLGGSVRRAMNREYGKTDIRYDTACALFDGLEADSVCWMSHTYYIDTPPRGFAVCASTQSCPVAAFCDADKKLYAVQFHPEVVHTRFGNEILKNFLYKICGAAGGWTMDSYADTAVKDIKRRVGGGRVLLGLSGGVDSSVAAVLLDRAVGDKLTCIFVDHGLLRKDEAKQVEEVFSSAYGMKLICVDASERFLSRLKGVTEPEQKRRIIGEEFIRVFEAEAKRIGAVDFLAQGTIYPDVIESGKGHAAVIKSHHNVGGLPDCVDFKEIIEPLRDLFKDEVRALGETLGMPRHIVWRQPFPGPGLAIRIIGDVTAEKVKTLQQADAIFREEITGADLDREIWQYFAVLTDMRSVGVMGDERTYDHTVALRAVTSVDGMTADWARIPPDVMEKISNRIVNEVKHVNRVVYDVTSKPPATIEWE
jgi:GMP synthase (glutamine-hydrolyzing), C-terminal domain or B subunit/GMP synthase (glutamine-hydrolyzing), N-terminal domain or A subunit